MTILNVPIPRRASLAAIAGALVASCQGVPRLPSAEAASRITPAPKPTTVENSEAFARWVTEVKTEAAGRGISGRILDEAFHELALIPRVVELDRQQPEFSQTFARYLGNAVSDRRVEEGRQALNTHAGLLGTLEREYGVQSRFLVAFWGLETNYGRVTGGYPVIAALATLAFDGRRAAFFREELFNALRIADAGHIPLSRMQGSWAGAMGHTQFMPSTFLRHAVDRDGDRHIDIWGSLPDALGSAANYLRSMNWEGDRTWGREVRLPAGFDISLISLDVDARETVKSLEAWSALGVTRTDGRALPEQPLDAALVLPQGVKGPAFLLYENYRTILRWNRSAFYAIAVGHLADRLTGAGPLVGSLPNDPPLSRDDVTALQEGLIAQGFLTGNADGVVGSMTRQAVRRFQAARGLPPDGYADRQLITAVTRT